MRTDEFYASKGVGQIHVCRWMPDEPPVAVLQIIHGIAEHVERYDEFANYMNRQGFIVVAEDHMGHGKSINGGGIQGYFHCGWFTAVDDSYELLQRTKAEFPALPYVLLGHSMGSFMTRTLLCKYPDCGISAAVICGTGWQPEPVLDTGVAICSVVCNRIGEQAASERLQNLVFSNYNKRVEHPRTAYDWLSRDAKIVDAYIAHPMCGFTPTAGLLREMMKGLTYIEKPAHLEAMKKDLPVFFVAGGDDPVGSYGKGVKRTVSEFKKAGMTDVSCRIYPLCRHEILNEINRQEIFEDIGGWILKKVEKA